MSCVGVAGDMSPSVTGSGTLQLVKTGTARRSLAYVEVLMVAPTVLTLSQANSKIAACPSLSVLPAGTVNDAMTRVIARRSFTPRTDRSV